MSLGGAWSIDKAQREPGISWWNTETITDEDVKRAIGRGKIDVLFSHDTVSFIQVPGIIPLEEGERNRYQVDKVVKACLPSLVVHGHYHINYTRHDGFPIGADTNGLVYHEIQVMGLGCDNHKPNPWESFSVLDTEKFASKEHRMSLN